MIDEETRSNAASGLTAEGAADEWLGRVIDDRYRIIERLGEGGMGAVFVAEHTKLQKRVALKVIHAHFAGNDEIAARFAREAMTSAHVEHPNVASALDFGALPEGGAYLVMQLVRGPSLSQHLEEHGALAYPEACRIAAQIADAIAAAHASGIVHRDLKPDNVVLMANDDGSQTVKVLDFGIAHVKAQNAAPDRVSKALTRVGVVIGTPGYMPPEQATGQAVDERADLYALGVMLWELLTGVAPFRGQTFSEIVTRQLNAPAPELVLGSDRELPAELRQLVRALLERAPADRPSSASEVRDTLSKIAAQRADAGSSPGLYASSNPITASLLHTATDALQSLRKPSGAAVAALALLALVGALSWALSDDDVASTVTPTPPITTSTKASAATERSNPEPQRASPVTADTSEPSEVEPEEAKPSAQRASSKKGQTRSKSDPPRPVRRLRRALDDLLQ